MAFHLMMALLLILAGWQQGKPAGSKTPYVEKSEKEFAFYPGGKLEISAAIPGNVQILGWQKSSIRVEMEKVFFYLSAEQAQAFAKRYPVRVTNTPTTARISSSGSPQTSAAMEVNFIVYVPGQRTDLDIKMIQGDLSITSLNGSVEAIVEQGNLEARDLSGYFSGLTKRGDMTVELSGPRWTGYGFTAATRKGAIELRLPADYSATLQLETRDGKITVDYPDQIVQDEPVPLPVIEKKKIRSVNAPIGAGGTLIKLMTLSGDVALKAKR